jgi:hypothetical protein
MARLRARRSVTSLTTLLSGPLSVKAHKTRSKAMARTFAGMAVDDQAIPFIVVAGKGWTRERGLRQFCERLKSAVPKPKGRTERPHALVVTLDPPAVGGFGSGEIEYAQYGEEERGVPLATVWYWVVVQARKHSGHTLRNLPLRKYFEGVPEALTQEPPRG